MDLSKYLEYLYVLPILIFSVVVHETAHGWVALSRGDTTAKDMGRLTLNPIPHIDIVGSVLLPLFLILSGARFFIAWAKPVPIDPRNFRNFRLDDSLVTAAGPISNFIMAFFCSLAVIAIKLALDRIEVEQGSIGWEFLNFLFKMFSYGILLNVMLAIFNLFPIPPLDGSHLLANILPEQAAWAYRRIGFFGVFIILALFNFVPAFSIFFYKVIIFFTTPYLRFVELFVPDFSQMYFS
jgi:Zn-dependent protease